MGVKNLPNEEAFSQSGEHPVKRLFSQFSDSHSFRQVWISQVTIVGLVRVHRSYLHKRTFESNVTYREMRPSWGPSSTETMCSSRWKQMSIASLQLLKCWAFSQWGWSLLLCFHFVLRALKVGVPLRRLKWYVGWNKAAFQTVLRLFAVSEHFLFRIHNWIFVTSWRMTKLVKLSQETTPIF